MANPQMDPDAEGKRKAILYGGSITAILYLSAAWYVTQSIAAATDYHPLLGGNLELFGAHIYFPLKYMFWKDDPAIAQAIPNILNDYKWPTILATAFGLFIMFLIAKNAKVDISHGSASFAKDKDITESDLGYYETSNGGVFKIENGKKVPKVSGVVVGINPYTKKLMLHNGPEHILLMAPTRSGKGINTIIPTGLVWKASIFFFDPKGELWANTAGYRKEKLHQKVMKFEPLCVDGSANRWNPLAEINFRTNEEISDVKTVVDVMVKPDGEKKGGGDPFWDNSAINLMNGVIMHLMYKHYKEERPLPSPTDIMSFLSSPDKGTKDLFADMMTYPHIRPEEFLEEMHPVQKLNDKGNPVFDAEGNPVYVEDLDKDGNPQLVPEMDKNGNPIQETVYDSNWMETGKQTKYRAARDRKGNILYRPKRGEDGKPLTKPVLDADGNPVMQKKVLASGKVLEEPALQTLYEEKLGSDGKILYKPRRDEKGEILRDADGKPVFEPMLDAKGEPMQDEEGNPVYEPIYEPVYLHKFKMERYVNPLRQIYGNYYVPDMTAINEKLTELVSNQAIKIASENRGGSNRGRRQSAKAMQEQQNAAKEASKDIIEKVFPQYVSRDKERRFRITAKTIPEIQSALRKAIQLGVPQLKSADDFGERDSSGRLGEPRTDDAIDWYSRKVNEDDDSNTGNDNPVFYRLLVHPRVAEAAATIYNGAEQTSASIMQTAQTALGVYGDPVVQRNMCVSDFCIRDLLDPKQEVSCYLVMQVKDIATVRPISRLFINTILNKLIRDMKFDVGGTAKKAKKQRLLLMLDEFPQLGNMKSVELALAICAGYGIKMCIVCQDVNQLNKEYTKDNSIASNCHVHIYFTPNLDPSGSTAKAISETLGKKTIKSISHSDGGGGFGKGSNSISSQARELMTADEVAKMSTENELVFVAGHKPILGNKLRYYLYDWFKKRVLPTPLLSDPITKIETYGELFKMHEADTLDRQETIRNVAAAKERRFHGDKVAELIVELKISRDEAEALYQKNKAEGLYEDVLGDEAEEEGSIDADGYLSQEDVSAENHSAGKGDSGLTDAGTGGASEGARAEGPEPVEADPPRPDEGLYKKTARRISHQGTPEEREKRMQMRREMLAKQNHPEIPDIDDNHLRVPNADSTSPAPSVPKRENRFEQKESEPVAPVRPAAPTNPFLAGSQSKDFYLDSMDKEIDRLGAEEQPDEAIGIPTGEAGTLWLFNDTVVERTENEGDGS